FICTGYLYQFDPFDKVPLSRGVVGDKGHISPVSYSQLRYFSEHFGMTTMPPAGDRKKRKILAALLFPFLLIGKWWAYRDWKKTSADPSRKEIIEHLYSTPLLLSRSLIFSASKPL